MKILMPILAMFLLYSCESLAQVSRWNTNESRSLNSFESHGSHGPSLRTLTRSQNIQILDTRLTTIDSEEKLYGTHFTITYKRNAVCKNIRLEFILNGEDIELECASDYGQYQFSVKLISIFTIPTLVVHSLYSDEPIEAPMIKKEIHIPFLDISQKKYY